MCRRCGEPDRRPTSKQRRQLRQKLIDRWGDGTTVDCGWKLPGVCTGPLTFATVELDRIVPGHAPHNGTYRFDNLIPACGPCNRARAYNDPDLPDGCAAGVDWPEWHPRNRGRTA